MSDITCPHCENEIYASDIDHNASEDTLQSCYCGNCNKGFGVRVSIFYSYNEVEVSCFNEDKPNHDWGAIVTNPIDCTRAICSICDEERNLTNIEKEILFNNGIDSLNNHLKSNKD